MCISSLLLAFSCTFYWLYINNKLCCPTFFLSLIALSIIYRAFSQNRVFCERVGGRKVKPSPNSHIQYLTLKIKNYFMEILDVLYISAINGNSNPNYILKNVKISVIKKLYQIIPPRHVKGGRLTPSKFENPHLTPPYQIKLGRLCILKFTDKKYKKVHL